MKAVITITDTPDGSSIEVMGQVEGAPEDALPSGAHIMYAYLNAHMDEITEKAQLWFREELIQRVAVIKDEVIHG